MLYALAGGSVVDAAQLNESLLDIITRRLRLAWRSFIDILKQQGNP